MGYSCRQAARVQTSPERRKVICGVALAEAEDSATCNNGTRARTLALIHSLSLSHTHTHTHTHSIKEATRARTQKHRHEAYLDA